MKKRKRRVRPGDYVRIVADCRPGAPETGSEAIYEGRFNLSTNKRYKGPRDHWWAIPRMRLPNGKYIWGLHCWWIPLNEAKLREKEAGVECTTGQRFPDPLKDLMDEMGPLLERGRRAGMAMSSHRWAKVHYDMVYTQGSKGDR